jgi:hypothetical protein
MRLELDTGRSDREGGGGGGKKQVKILTFSGKIWVIKSLSLSMITILVKYSQFRSNGPIT